MSRSHPSLPDRVAEAYRTLGVTGRIVLAVSGGADSVALLRATAEIAERIGATLAVAHLDHGLRPESNEDVAWVEHEAATLGLPCFTTQIDIGAVSASTGRGIEETARRLRYDFLTEAAERFDACFVATAHTADDLAETVLFHILRGTGLRGLRGIPPRRRLTDRVTLVRPMLDVARPEIERYLASLGQPFLTDPSNADRSFTRNRLRHEMLPLLRDSVNPRLDDALRRLSRQADEVSSLLSRLARRELRPAVLELTPEVIRLRCRRLARCPEPLIRETVALAWRRARWPRQGMGFSHWDAIARIVVLGGRRTLPGGTDVRRRRGELILRRPAR